MLSLSGQLLNIVSGQRTDPKTGVITSTFTAEILHQSAGKSVVDSVKIDTAPAVVEGWRSVIGKRLQVEVRVFAMKGGDGGVMHGLTLADKTALPVVVNGSKAA